MNNSQLSASDKWTILNLANRSESRNSKDKKRAFIFAVVTSIGTTLLAIISLLGVAAISDTALGTALGILTFSWFLAYLTDLNATLTKFIIQSGVQVTITEEEMRKIAKSLYLCVILGLVVPGIIVVAMKLN